MYTDGSMGLLLRLGRRVQSLEMRLLDVTL